MRYEASYVVTTGVVSILSWSSLVWYSTYHWDTVITRSFIDYTNSHKVLIGAEIEKLLGIIVVTVISTLAVYRKKKLLLESAQDAFTKNNMTKFFSKEVAQNISTSSGITSGNGVIREAGILMIDLRNFTKITRSWTPQKTLSVISDYQEIIVPIIAKYNGSIDKYMGDGIFAHFGASSDSQTYAKDMISAMLEINQAGKQWVSQRTEQGETPIDLGQASCVGPVIFGTTGSNDRLEYTTIGNAVNSAAKLEKHTKVLGVQSLTTLNSFEKAKKQGFELNLSSIVKMDSQPIDGMKEPIDIIILD